PLEALQVREAIRAGEAALEGCGRLLIRKSGTEPVIRVMAEGEDEGLVLQVIDEISRAIEAAGRAWEKITLAHSTQISCDSLKSSPGAGPRTPVINPHRLTMTPTRGSAR